MNAIVAILTVFLSGAWFTFGLPLSNLQFGTRLLIGAMLSPLLICLEFFAIRIIGVPFAHTAMIIFVLNLPALYLLYKKRDAISFPDRWSVITHILLLLVPFTMVLARYVNPQIRAYLGGHVWMHTDIIYMLGNGQLIVEEPELAGIRLTYPWAGHVFQAVISSLLDESPVFNYSWTMLFWLVCLCLLASKIVRELGGNQLSQATGMIWLFFGVNFVGYTLQHIILGDTINLRVWGDYRYSPWVSYFLGFNQLILALGMISGLILLLVRKWPRGFTWGPQTLIGLLLFGTGIIYPVLFPVSCLAVAARVVAMIIDRASGSERVCWKQILGLIVVLLTAGLLTLGYLSFLFESRTDTFPVQVEGFRALLRRGVESALVLLPLLIGLGFLPRKFWQTNRNAAFVLVIGGFVTTSLSIAFNLHEGQNNYKFILAASLFLFPFTPLALEPLMTRLGRRVWMAVGVLVILLITPLAHKFYTRFNWNVDQLPRLEREGFAIRLEEGLRFSRLFDSIRRGTPRDCILVLEKSDLHFPTLTRRSLYVSPAEKDFKPGYNYPHTYNLVSLRGYGREIVETRRSRVQDFFGVEDSRRSRALSSILELDRPVAIVLDVERHNAALEWLIHDGRGSRIHQSDGHIVWLIPRARKLSNTPS